MGVEYFLVVKDKVRKRALIIGLGRHYCKDACDGDIDMIDNALIEINNRLESSRIIDIDGTEVQKLTVGQLSDLIEIKRKLDDITYKTDIHSPSELVEIMKVYGLVRGLIDVWEKDEFEWEIVNEFGLFGYEENDEGLIGELKQEGYSVWTWGWKGDEG